MYRILTKTLFFALLWTTPTTAGAQDVRETALTTGLRDRVDALRGAASYHEAVAVAKELVQTLASNPASREFEIVDARWLLKTVETLAALPDSVSAQMTTIETLRTQYAELIKQLDYDSAAKMIGDVLVIQTALLGSNHPETAASIGELAGVEEARSHHVVSDSLYQAATAVFQNTIGSQHPTIADIHDRHAALLTVMGRFAAAEDIGRRGLGIRIAVFGDGHPDVAASIHTLAKIANAESRFNDAAYLYKKRIEILRSTFGPSHSIVVHAVESLASWLGKYGDHQEALQLYEQTLAALETEYSKDHVVVALTRHGLATQLTALGHYEKAGMMLDRSIESMRLNLGDDHEMLARALFDRGRVLLGLGKPDDAGAAFFEATSLFQKFREHHPDVARAQLFLSDALLAGGQADSAQTHLDRAAAILVNNPGPTSIDYARALSRRAEMLVDRGRYIEARPLLLKVCDRIETSPGESDGWRLSPFLLGAATEIALEKPANAWRFVERHNARFARTHLATTSLRQLTADQRVEETRLRWELGDAERAYARAADTAKDSLRAHLDMKETQWKSFRNRIAREYPLSEGYPADLGVVKTRLSPRSAIVGWLDVGARHYAYLIDPDSAVVWLELDSLDISPLCDSLLFAIVTGDTNTTRLRMWSRAVYNHRIRPLQDRLRHVDRLIVVPSGPMRSVPTAALHVDDYTTIADLWDVSYTPSASLVTRLRDRTRPDDSSTFLGIADAPHNEDQAIGIFHGDAGPEHIRIDRTPKWNRFMHEVSIGRPDPITMLPRLGAGRKDVDAAAIYFDNAVVLTGTDAAEPRLYDLARHGDMSQYRYVHIGTYTIPDPVRGERSSIILSQTGLPDALRTIAMGERTIDGRLTMEELMQTWRLDARLVTLSNCETAFQGVSGDAPLVIATALIRAGARSVLLSRWQIPDRPRVMFLKRFYQNLFARRMGMGAALRDAQRWLRDLTENGALPYSHPLYWSSFMLIGIPD